MDIKSTPGLVSLIYSGEVDELRVFLARWPEDKALIFAAEPYCVIQGKRKKECLQILCDDPRLVFDDIFVGRMLYFSTRECHQVVGNHPRLWKLMAGKKSFCDFIKDRNFQGWQGMYQRYYQAERVIQCNKNRKNRFRLAFYLYPFLVLATRAWVERHYAPGGAGYLRYQKQWDADILSSTVPNIESHP